MIKKQFIATALALSILASSVTVRAGESVYLPELPISNQTELDYCHTGVMDYTKCNWTTIDKFYDDCNYITTISPTSSGLYRLVFNMTLSEDYAMLPSFQVLIRDAVTKETHYLSYLDFDMDNNAYFDFFIGTGTYDILVESVHDKDIIKSLQVGVISNCNEVEPVSEFTKNKVVKDFTTGSFLSNTCPRAVYKVNLKKDSVLSLYCNNYDTNIATNPLRGEYEFRIYDKNLKETSKYCPIVSGLKQVSYTSFNMKKGTYYLAVEPGAAGYYEYGVRILPQVRAKFSIKPPKGAVSWYVEAEGYGKVVKKKNMNIVLDAQAYKKGDTCKVRIVFYDKNRMYLSQKTIKTKVI